MATGMERDAAARMVEHLTDPGDRMRLELHTAPVEVPVVEPGGSWASGGFIAPCEFDDDTVGPVVVSDGYIELTIDVVDRFTPRLRTLLRMVESMNAVRSSFAGLGRAMSDFSLDPWPQLYVAPDPAGDVLYPAVSPQPWADHDRKKTSLELAIERWKRENPPPPPPPSFRPMTFGFRPTTFGEAAGQDTTDCSSSNGARWSDLMSRIDELTEET